MKKRMLVAVGIAVMLMALSPAAVLAGPTSPPNYGKYNPADLPNQPPEEWGVEKAIPSPSTPGGVVRIITDPLVGSSPADGWVTFWCQSRLGFQYNIGATGLAPLSTYSVEAHGARFQIVPEGTEGALELEGLYILPSPQEVHLDLGTFKSDANGSGGVRGVKKLEAGYAYDVATFISDADGAVLESPGWELQPNDPARDTNGFIVY